MSSTTPNSNSTCISMLPNQTSDLPLGYHRRQNSTPTVPIAPKVPLLPATQPQYDSHRRGQSLDQMVYDYKTRGLSQQDKKTVSIDQGLYQYQQHTMREAQQQQPMARPGQLNEQEPVHQNDPPRYIQPTPEQDFGTAIIADDDFFKQQPNTKDDIFEFISKYSNTDISQNTNFAASAGYLEGLGDEMVGDVQDRSDPGEINDLKTPCNDGLPGSWPGSLRPESREGHSRPSTPIKQTATSYFPITPATTPFGKYTRVQQASESRTAGSSPVGKDPNMIIKASHAMQRGSSWQDSFSKPGTFMPSAELPSPPKTGRHKRPKSFDIRAIPPPDFLNLENLKLDFPTSSNGYDLSHYSPMSNALSPTLSSFQPSPELAHMSLFGTADNLSDFPISPRASNLPISKSAVDLGTYPSPVKEPFKPRSQSIPELDLEIDASIEDTGVTSDEIASFICGPDLIDQKWMCTYDGCGKKFGRKENIKSHVQTHLGDRQFRCNHCNKCFVRQHDLKRHGKIHSGIKPYMCPCGNGFARHDALTRHRQRNTCVGGFGGPNPKQPTKRGRPKKTRPDTEERLDKAAKTRQRVLERACASSVSGSSESSYPSPPQLFDDMDICGVNTLDNIESLPLMTTGLPPDFFTYTPPTSPGYSTGNCYSSHHSQHSRTPKAVSMSPSPQITTIPEDELDAQLDLISQAMSREGSGTGSDDSSEPEVDVDQIFQDLLNGPNPAVVDTESQAYSDRLEDVFTNPWADLCDESSTQNFDQALTMM